MKGLKRLWCRWFGHKWGDWIPIRDDFVIGTHGNMRPLTGRLHNCSRCGIRHIFHDGVDGWYEAWPSHTHDTQPLEP